MRSPLSVYFLPSQKSFKTSYSHEMAALNDTMPQGPKSDYRSPSSCIEKFKRKQDDGIVAKYFSFGPCACRPIVQIAAYRPKSVVCM